MNIIKTSVKKLNSILLVLFAFLSCLLIVGKTYTQSKFAYAEGAYTVSYELSGVVVNDRENHLTAQEGVDFVVSLSPDDSNGYAEFIVDYFSVTIAGSSYEGYTFNDYTGVLTIPGADIVGDISITAEATNQPTVYQVDLTSNGSETDEISHATRYNDFVVQYTPIEGKILYPTPYAISVGGESIIDNPDAYTYDRSIGELVIKAQYVTGDIFVRWNAQDLVVKDFIANANIDGDPVEIILNQELSFYIIPDTHYNYPQNILLTYATNSGAPLAEEDYTYDSETGLVTILADKVTDVICVSGEAAIKQATVTYNLSNATNSAYQTYPTDLVPYLSTWYVSISANPNYRLVNDKIEVKVGGQPLIQGDQYELAGSGRLWIKQGIITGDIEIIVEAVSNIVEITYDLKNFEITDAPTTWVYDNSGLSMFLTYIDEAGYAIPNNKSIEYFMVYKDGVAQTDGETQTGWSITAAYKLSINKATTMCQKLHIVAHAMPIEYTINLSTDVYGTLKQESITYTKETQEDPLANVIESIQDGYTLDYWEITLIDDGASWTGNRYTWQAGNYGNISVKAIYKNINYTITVLPGDHGSVSASSITYTCAMSQIAMPTVTADAHYTFVRWEIVVSDGSWEMGEFVYTSGNTGNITVVAMYERIQYKIVLDVSYGGTLSGDSVLTYTIDTATMPDLETPTTPDEFTFIGWEITTATGSWQEGPYSWGGLGSYGDIVVTAKYTEKDYTITFALSTDCTYDMQSITYTAGQQNVLLPEVVANEHLSFSHWLIEQSDGTWTVGEEFDYVPNKYGNITLKPMCTPIQYTITLRADNKGTLAITTYSYTYFTIVAPDLNQPVPYNAGYKFSHWEVVDTIGSWTAGNVYDWQNNAHGNVVLIARYEALSTTYTVEIYYQTLDFSSYVLGETFVETGKTWETKTIQDWQRHGFEFNASHQDNVLTNYLSGNGTEVFKLYYLRNTYSVTYTLTNLTERAALVSGKEINPYSVVFGQELYVYLDPATDYHLNISSIKFKVDGYEENVPYTKAATSNRLYFAPEAFAGNLEIIAEGRPNFFSITYELTGVQVLDDGTDYSKIDYDTQLKIPLELTADSSIYAMPNKDTVKIYVDDVLITAGYLVSNTQGFIQLYKTAAVGNIKIVAAAAYKEYTITIKAATQFTIKYNYTTEIVLPESTTPGLILSYYTFVSNSYNQQWGVKYPERIITDLNVGSGLIGNITLTPYYSEITYKIKFIVGEHGSGLTTTKNYTVNTISTPTPPTYNAHQGYRFDKWVVIDVAEDSSWPIGDYEWVAGRHGDITVQAVFVGRDDTKYEVKHYFETLSGSYELNSAKTQQLQGTTDTEVVAQPLNEIGFSFDANNENNYLSGNVNANGTLVLNVYYVRNLYSITIAINHGEYGSLDGNIFENVKFGSPIIIQGNTVSIGDKTITAHPIAPTETQVFEFVAWDISGEVVENDLTIAANFQVSTRYYTVIFKNGDQVIKTLSLEYNQVPIFDGENPTKEGSETLTYTFDGWTIEGSSQVLVELPAITEDTIFNAHYNIEDLSEPESNNMMIIIIGAGGGAVVLIVIIIICVVAKKKKVSKRF